MSSTYTDAKSDWMLSTIYDRDGTPLAAADKWGAIVIAEVDLNERRVGPNNLGDFRAMVQRHRPVPLPETTRPTPASRPTVP